MSLDTATPPVSPIENEIPAYRAISSLAVTRPCSVGSSMARVRSMATSSRWQATAASRRVVSRLAGGGSASRSSMPLSLAIPGQRQANSRARLVSTTSVSGGRPPGGRRS